MNTLIEEDGSKSNDSWEEFDIVIQPRHSIATFPLKELLGASELLYFLVWRDLKVRYTQSVIGAAWAILKPLMLMVVFVVIFGIFMRVPTGNVPYSVVVYSGLLTWIFVTTLISSAAVSLQSNSTILTKTYFPRLVAPVSVSIVALIDLLISIPILFGLMLWYDIPLTLRALWLLPIFAMIFLLAFGIGVIMAALHVQYRDIGLMLPILFQVWMYATPIVYPIETVPTSWLPIYSLNPLVGLMQGVRWALLGATSPTFLMVAISCTLTIGVLIVSILFFQVAEDTFADVI